MTINPLLSAVSSALAQQSAPVSVRSASAVTDSSASASKNVSDSQPSQSVLQSASLLNASSNFAQLGSLLEVAQSGTEQIGQIIEQLQSLAQQANNGGDTDLATEFQQALAVIDQTVASTSFGGKELLNGTQSGSAGGQTLSLPDLSTEGLFGTNTPSISTPQDAESALTALSQAQDTVSKAGAAIDNALGQLSFASATVDSALANNAAASSTLSESDLEDGASSDLSSFISRASSATLAQSGDATENLLSLLQE